MPEENYKQLTAREIASLTTILITADGKGTREKSSALSKLLLDAYNEGKLVASNKTESE